MNRLPNIAMGAWAWGNDGTFGSNYTAADLKAVYGAAMKNGLNLWDTAVVYGMGTSENILGELTKDTPREELVLSTKFTPQIEDQTPQTAIAWAITKNTLPIVGVTKVHHVEDAAKAAWNDDGWIMEALKVHYKTLVRYLNFKDQGMVLGVGCKTPSMTKKSKFLQAAYNLGKSI